MVNYDTKLLLKRIFLVLLLLEVLKLGNTSILESDGGRKKYDSIIENNDIENSNFASSITASVAKDTIPLSTGFNPVIPTLKHKPLSTKSLTKISSSEDDNVKATSAIFPVQIQSSSLHVMKNDSNPSVSLETAGILPSRSLITEQSLSTFASSMSSTTNLSTGTSSEKTLINKVSSLLATSFVSSSYISVNKYSTTQLQSSKVKTEEKSCPTIVIISSYCPSLSTAAVKPASSIFSIHRNNISSTQFISSMKISSTSTLMNFSASVSHSKSTTQQLTSHYSSLAASSFTDQTKHFSPIIKTSTPSPVIPDSTAFPTILPPMDECKAVTLDFSSAVNNFTDCVLHHFDPMTVCMNCMERYQELRKQHHQIKGCTKKLITKFNAEYQIIPLLYESQMSIWRSLDCEKCYKDGSLTEDYIEFQRLYKEVMGCFKNHTAKNTTSLIAMANISSWNKTNKRDVCKNCPEVYNKLQKTYPYYRDGDAEQGSLWCADIDVAVNETRKLWSLSYHCGKKKKDLVAIIALTCIFCFMPILFYVGAKLHSDVRERKNANGYCESD